MNVEQRLPSPDTRWPATGRAVVSIALQATARWGAALSGAGRTMRLAAIVIGVLTRIVMAIVPIPRQQPAMSLQQHLCDHLGPVFVGGLVL